MHYLFLFLGFCSFILCSFSVNKFLPDYLKRYSFICAISLISTILFVLTFHINFLTLQYIFYAISIIIFSAELIQNKCLNLKCFILENKIIFIFSAFWLLITCNAQITGWDDFSYGLFTKHINQFGTYWTSESVILSIGLKFLPGLFVWESFFIGRNFFFEQPLFFSLGLIFISCFCAIRPSQYNKKENRYLFLLFCAPISWFAYGIGGISLDTSIGLVLGIALLSGLDLKKPSDLFVPFSIALFVAILKETAFLLSLLIILLIVVKSLREKRFFSTWTVYSIICLAIIIFNYQQWQWHFKNEAFAGTFDNGQMLTKLSSDFHHLSKHTKDILHRLLLASFQKPLPRSFLSRIPLPGFSYLKGFYLFWAFLFAAIMFQIREKYEYLIIYFWGLIGYSLVLVITYVYFFGEYEASQLTSFERYTGTYFLAISLVAIKIILEKELWNNKVIFRCLLFLILIFPPSPNILHPHSVSNLIPKMIVNKFKLKINHSRDDIIPIANQIANKTPNGSKIWLIWQNTMGLQTMILRYEIAPRKLIQNAWSLGEKYSEGDVWTDNMSIDNFMKFLMDTDYLALGFVDENFSSKYGPIFKTPPKSGSLYKKEFINNQLHLVEI